MWATQLYGWSEVGHPPGLKAPWIGGAGFQEPEGSCSLRRAPSSENPDLGTYRLGLFLRHSLLIIRIGIPDGLPTGLHNIHHIVVDHILYVTNHHVQG